MHLDISLSKTPHILDQLGDWQAALPNIAVIVIDMQDDVFSYSGTPREPVIDNVRALLDHAIKQKWPIVYNQHLYRSLPPAYLVPRFKKNPTLVPGTKGAEFAEKIAPRAHDIVIEKPYMDGFIESHLNGTLQSMQVGTILLCGVMTHLCVRSTALSGISLGYKAIVIKEACATLNSQMHLNNLEDMEKMGILTLDLATLLTI